MDDTIYTTCRMADESQADGVTRSGTEGTVVSKHTFTKESFFKVLHKGFPTIPQPTFQVHPNLTRRATG